MWQAARGANHERRSKRCSGNGRSPRAAEGRRYHAAGCTIDGIMELEEGKLRVTLIKAVVKATSRAGELLFEK